MNRKNFFMLLLLLFVIAFIIDTSFFNIYGTIVLLGIALCVFLFFIMYREENNAIARVYFRPIHLFMISFYIVCFQSPIDILLGYQVDPYLVGKIDLMPEAVKVSLLGIISFLIGYITNTQSVNDTGIAKKIQYAPTTIYKVLGSTLLFLIFLFIPQGILFGGYHTEALQESNYKYFASWSMIMCAAFFIQYIINMKRQNRGKDWSVMQLIKDIGWWQNINIIVYAIVILNLGDRGGVIYMVTAYYLVYISVTGKCPSKKTLIVGITTGVLFAAFLGYSKGFRDNNTIFERVETTWESNPYEDLHESVLTPTYELSLSYRCLPFAIQDVQLFENYGYGRFQLYNMLPVIPFTGQLVDLKGSGYYITRMIQGDNPNYGNGTTIIADFYLDGGLIFVILGMFIFGYLVKNFDLILFANKKSSFVMYCSAFCFSMYFISTPRSTALGALKAAVWVAVLLYLYQQFYNYGNVKIKSSLKE